MTGMSFRKRLSQVRDGANYYVSACARETGARLTQVAKAVYAREPVKHFCDGASQILFTPTFTSIAEQTWSLLLLSLNTNIWWYLIPAILIPRFVPAIRQTDLYDLAPDKLEKNLQKLEYILFGYMIRLFLRRRKDNIEYAVAFPRVIKNDIDIWLPRMLSEELANQFVEIFNQLFAKSHQTQLVHDNLLLDFLKVFERFFMKLNINAESFSELKEPISDILEATLNDYYPVDTAKFHKEFSRQLADEFIKVVANAFQPPDVPEKKAAKDDLYNVLAWKFTLDDSKQFAGDIRQRLLKVKTKIEVFLPVVYYPPCQCIKTNVITGTTYPSLEYYRKTSLAEISYGPYMLGNDLFTYLPAVLFSLLNLIIPIPGDVFLALQVMSILARALNTGFYLNGLKIPSHCSRDRAWENSRHKMYALGVGLSQWALTESVAQLVLYASGIRNFCTDDAIFQMSIQLLTIAILANNHRLPGTEKYPWNPFYLSQRATRAVLNKVNSLLAAIQESSTMATIQKSPEEFLANLRYFGNMLKVFVWITLGPGSFFPAMPTAKNKMIFLQNESTHHFLKIFRRDLQVMLQYIETARTASNWITMPASWVAPNIFVMFLVVSSKILNDATLIALLKKIEGELKNIEKEGAREVQVIENSNADNPDNLTLELTPAILDETPQSLVPVPMITYSIDESKTVEAEIAEGILTDLRDANPLAVIPEKKPADMTTAISTESYFKSPVKKRPVMVDGFELLQPAQPSVSSAAYQRNAFLGNRNSNHSTKKPVVKPKTTWALPQLK